MQPQAARYQMIVMFIIASTTSVASVATITLAAFYIVDGQARLRSDLLTRRDRQNSWTARVQRGVLEVCSRYLKGVWQVLNGWQYTD